MVKVVAKNRIQKDKLEEAIKLYGELVDATRKEEGCISYELYQDKQDESILTFIEEWKSKQALDEHMRSEHFTRIVPMTGKLSAGEAEVNIYSKLL